MFDYHVDHRLWHFWICDYFELILIQQLYAHFLPFGSFFLYLHIGKETRNFFLHFYRIDIADDDDRLQLRSVPAFVEVPDELMFESCDYSFGTYRKSFGIQRTIEKHRKVLVLHTLLSSAVAAHLFHDDTAFFVNLF